MNKLNKWHLQAQWATKISQCRRKVWHNKHLKLNKFQPSQLLLKYNGRNEIKPGKFKVKWVGPYKIHEVGNNRPIKLWTLDGKEVIDPVNRLKLKIYHEQNEDRGNKETRTNDSARI